MTPLTADHWLLLQHDFHGIIKALRLQKYSEIIRARCLFFLSRNQSVAGLPKPPPPTAGTKPSPHPRRLLHSSAPGIRYEAHPDPGTATLPPAQLPLPSRAAIWAQFLQQNAAEAAQCFPLQGPAALTWRLAANHSDSSHCLFSSILVFLVLWKIRAGRQAIHQPVNAAEPFGFVLNNCAFYCYLHIYFPRQ